MAILTGPEIVRRIEAGDIVIDPFVPEHVGPNSVDLRLGETLMVYGRGTLDVRRDNPMYLQSILRDGHVLEPGELYLGTTVERTWARNLVPCIEGRSSLARLGMMTHLSAGFGDCGWEGQWTLEIAVLRRLRIYPGMRVCQVSFAETVGEIRPYAGKYQDQSGPTASRAWMDKE